MLSSSRERGPGTYLVLEDGVEFEIPQYYDEFAPSLRLPSFDSLQIEEKVVYGRLKATAFFAIVDADPWTALWRKKYDTGEKETKRRLLEKRRFGLQVSPTRSFGDTLLSRACNHVLVKLSCSFPFCKSGTMQFLPFVNDSESSALQVIDTPVVINPPPVEDPEDDVGVGSEEAGFLDESLVTFRHISTENGQTRRCEVKVLEHGDGYEVLHLGHRVSCSF